MHSLIDIALIPSVLRLTGVKLLSANTIRGIHANILYVSRDMVYRNPTQDI